MRKRLMAVLLGSAVAFAAVEGTLRLTQPKVDLLDRTGKQAGTHPMADWAHVDAFSAYRAIPGSYLHTHGKKTVNRDGYVSTPDIACEKGPRTLRIAFLGGSSTACSVPVLPDEQTWPWLVARKLDETLKDRDVDFLNAALPGYSTFESYGRLWSRVRFYRPDVVVVYHGWNDMYYFADPTWLRRRHVLEDGSWSFERPMIRQRIKPHPIDAWIGWSQLLVRIRRAFAERLEGEVDAARAHVADDYDPRALEIFRENLKLMLAAQKILGFKLFVCKQATMVVPGEREHWTYHGFSYAAHVRAFEAIYKVIDDEVPADQVLDVRHLSGDATALHDHIHLSADGSRRVAEAIAAQLGPRLQPGE